MLDLALECYMEYLKIISEIKSQNFSFNILRELYDIYF